MQVLKNSSKNTFLEGRSTTPSNYMCVYIYIFFLTKKNSYAGYSFFCTVKACEDIYLRGFHCLYREGSFHILFLEEWQFGVTVIHLLCLK